MRKALVATVVVLAFASQPAMAKVWSTDYAQSSLTFTGTQSNQSFTGKFSKFQTMIDFDPSKPEAGRISATIDVTSASTGDGEIDHSLPQSTWFDSSKFPKAEFVSDSIRTGSSPSCYEASGHLTIKGISKAITLPFCLTPEGDGMRAKGQVNLMRTDFTIGTGSWATDKTVAYSVAVGVNILAK